MNPETLQRLVPKRLRTTLNAGRFGLDDFVAHAAGRVGAGRVVIDVGAGDCPYANLFRHTFYVAIDRVRPRLEAGGPFSRIAADMERLPIRSGVADAVLHTQALEHVPSPSTALTEVYRILTPGGYLFASVPLFDGEHEMPHDYWRFTSRGIGLLLAKAGFNVESISKRGGYFWVLNKQLRSIHEYLFPPRKSRVVKALRFPLKLCFVLMFEIVMPLVFYRLDALDKHRDYTVGFLVIGRKPSIPAVAGASETDPRTPDSQNFLHG